MSLYHTTDAEGISEISPPPARLRELIQLLDDPHYLEHDLPEMSLTHDPSGWSLTLHPNGTVQWEQLDAGEEHIRSLHQVPRNQAYEMWLHLSRGDIQWIEQLAWK